MGFTHAEYTLQLHGIKLTVDGVWGYFLPDSNQNRTTTDKQLKTTTSNDRTTKGDPGISLRRPWVPVKW